MYLLVAWIALAAEDPFVGRWIAADQSGVYEVAACGKNELCGVVIGMKPLEESGCGMRFLHLTKWNAAKKKWDGSVYDPESRKDYPATLEVKSDGKLALRASWGLLSFKEEWLRFTGKVARNCEILK